MQRARISCVIATICLLFATLCCTGEKSKLVTNLELGKHQILITYGTSLTAGSPWVTQLKAELDSRYPKKVQVINSAKRGMWSNWGVEHLEERVIRYNPDAVILEFAINDAYLPYRTSVEQARSNLENMIERILKSNADCEIVLMVMNPPTGLFLTSRPNIKEYYQMYREVAKARKLLLVDHYPNWMKILDQNIALFKKYVPDGVHPGPEGCKKVIMPQILKVFGMQAVSVAAQANNR